MTAITDRSVERLADQFVNYLFDEYRGTRHVRRVATWIGFILKAIERASAGSLGRNRSRQLTFSYRGHEFKARYNHHSGSRGGIEIVEVLSLQGSPDGRIAATVMTLAEAEQLYATLEQQLDAVIAQ